MKRNRIVQGLFSLAMVLALLAVPIAVFAADLFTSAELSGNVYLPTEVWVGNNSFTIRVWANGNLPARQSGEATVYDRYIMDTAGNISVDSSSFETLRFLTDFNYDTNQDCSVEPYQEGCRGNPFEVTATLFVTPGTPVGTLGLLTTSIVGSSGLTAPATQAAGWVIVVGDTCYDIELLPPVTLDKPFNRNSTLPVKLQVWDDGENISGMDLDVLVFGLTKLDGEVAVDAEAVSAGNANPDSDFRYDADLDGYIFNLSLKGLTTGTWKLTFTVGPPTSSCDYMVEFQVK